MYPRALLTALTATLLVMAVAAIPAMASTPPVYPGAVAASRPTGVGFKAPPASAKTYVTTDSFSKVKSWYQTHLKGAQEMPEQGMSKTEDAFLVGSAAAGMVVMVESYQGKTWIVIGPPM